MRLGVAVIIRVVFSITALALPQSVPPTASSERSVTSHAAPNYPGLAWKMQLQGVAKVEASTNSRVKSTRVVGGNPVLAEAATEAVSKSSF